MTTTDQRNAREQLAAAADWLGWQDENLSFGLKSADDGLKLWRFWQERPDGPEMADEDVDGFDVPALRVEALGYDPIERAEELVAELLSAT